MNRILCFVSLFLCATLLSAGGETLSFSAARMSGTAGKTAGTTVLEGSAVVDVGSLRISGDRIELSGKDFRYVSAVGAVTGTDSEKGFAFSAESLTYDRELETALFSGNAKLVDSKNEVEAAAGMISYNQKTETAFLQMDVKLKRKEIDCTAVFATYRRILSLLDLSGSPRVLRDGDEFRADRISVNLDTEYISLDGTVSGTLKDTEKEETP